MPDELPRIGSAVDLGQIKRDQAAEQFSTFVRNAYEKATGQPCNRRARQAMSILAAIVSNSVLGAMNGNGPDFAARWAIGSMAALADEWAVPTDEPEGDDA